MKTLDFLKRKQKADADNTAPDPNGNNIIFGERQQCINPTILNSKRASLGYNPDKASVFNQCLPGRIKR
jgi:hypothetical protein